MKPTPELLALLTKAYPCPSFAGICGSMRWEPESGHIPRGFLGATGRPEEVELVLVFAEPGDPQPGDHKTLEEALDHAHRSFRAGNGVFHQKARAFFDLCWPDLAFEDQLKRVWVTESVLCSAAWSTGPVPRAIELECGERYLRGQLALFPNALVVALGSKAQDRLRRIGIRDFEPAHAFGLPGCYQKEAGPSWVRVAGILKERRKGSTAAPPRPRNLIIPPAPQPQTTKVSVAPLSAPTASTRPRRPERKQDMPASYGGDALRGGAKTDGVNYIVGTMLERGAYMKDIVQRLVEAGKVERAARAHLMFLHKNGVTLLVNGEEYQKGQLITADAFLTVRP